MFETSFVERPSQLIESIDDFGVLQKIVKADRRGGLLASKVKVEVCLEKEPYHDVKVVMDMIGKSSTIYEFLGVQTHCVRSLSDWNNLKQALMASMDGAPKLHVLSEISVSEDDFEEMRALLCSAGSLLLVVPAENSPQKPDHGKVSLLH
jgi:hypothetical protein